MGNYLGKTINDVNKYVEYKHKINKPQLVNKDKEHKYFFDFKTGLLYKTNFNLNKNLNKKEKQD